MLQYMKQSLSVFTRKAHLVVVYDTAEFLDPVSHVPSTGIRGSTHTLFDDNLQTRALGKAVKWHAAQCTPSLHHMLAF